MQYSPEMVVSLPQNTCF